ncbi:MAG: peptidase M14 [Gammaproteobacteria bacterium]|nr:MAG: peptidase M14 [Gammaproteobacteria bacterium]RKZ94417.1 MAG: peptidase M14 [Gammaproteobacteria bacterium]RKZ98259.1 MAG: peptidase M14 [Gammaproteobacteria bacterium]RKZ98960.1 MAG: peptidase M14 [Gammaproteobacteria bacterium]
MDNKLNSLNLQQLDYIPEGLLDASPESLHKLLSEPTLIHLSGKHKEPLFVSILLHGNEPTGFLAIQLLLKKYQNRSLPRSLSIFFGNTLAASKGLRRLDDQPDFNRIWPGTPFPTSPETEMATTIVEIMQNKNLFASIDIHNNTGLNPHYGCINKLEPQFLQLATLFARFVIYFNNPKGVQSAAFAEICPAITLECGRPDQQFGVVHALEFVDSCLNLTELPNHPVHQQDIDLFHTVAQVCIKDEIDFSFHDENTALLLSEDIEQLNFTEIATGTMLGQLNNTKQLPVVAKDEDGNDVSEQFFVIDHDNLTIKRPTMPSMLTLDEKVIRQDCLCYLMERIHL